MRNFYSLPNFKKMLKLHFLVITLPLGKQAVRFLVSVGLTPTCGGYPEGLRLETNWHRTKSRSKICTRKRVLGRPGG